MADRQTEERRAHNESLFRDANSKIADTATRLSEGEHSIPFLCECADRQCFEIVRLSASEYREVRSNPRWFLHYPGHDPGADETEVLVDDRGSHLIMEKVGHAAEVAEEQADTG